MKWKMATPRTAKNKPRRHFATSRPGTLLPGSERLAALVDGAGKDLPPGGQLIALFRPFLEYLSASDLSPKTIQKHVDNMWMLGGEFIRDLDDDPPQRKRPVEQHLCKRIEYAGPLLHHGSEDQQRSFDSTCRKFRRSSPRRLAEAGQIVKSPTDSPEEALERTGRQVEQPGPIVSLLQTRSFDLVYPLSTPNTERNTVATAAALKGRVVLREVALLFRILPTTEPY